MHRPADRDRLLIAEIGAAHGLRGAAKLRLFAEDYESLRAIGVLVDDQGQEYTIRTARVGKRATEAIAEFVHVTTREAIEVLRGTKLYTDRTALPAPSDDEFYHTDLIGLEARDVESAEKLGNISALYNFGAGDILEITTKSGKEIMHPFDAHFTPEIHLEEGYVLLQSFDKDGA